MGECMSMNRTLSEFPLSAVKSRAAYVLVDWDFNVLSEHESPTSASAALAQLFETYASGAKVLKRQGAAWLEV